jgi:hypothetical protein
LRQRGDRYRSLGHPVGSSSGLGQVTWWEFIAAVLIIIAGTVGMAAFAARIYSRAVLRTGGRVRGRRAPRTDRPLAEDSSRHAAVW